MAIYIGDNSTIKTRIGDKMYCLHITKDDMAESPREWDNLTIMACWHRRYALGDKMDKQTPEEFWKKLVNKYVSADEFLEAAKSGKFQDIRIVERPDNLVDVIDVHGSSDTMTEYAESLDYEALRPEDVKTYVLEDLSISELMELMKPYAEWLPLWLYDHSGLTISCGTRVYPYNDRWDSGQVGWIVALKDILMTNTTEILYDADGNPIREAHHHQDGSVTYGVKCRPLTEETWRKRAVEIMQADVKLYDMYLRGETYYFTLYSAPVPDNSEDADPDETPDWEEIDSCGGFYGDDLLENGILDDLPSEVAKAIRDDDYETGVATMRTVTYFDF